MELRDGIPALSYFRLGLETVIKRQRWDESSQYCAVFDDWICPSFCQDLLLDASQGL